MAMHLSGCSILTIKKMGRWKSDKSFAMYIHEQISGFSTGLFTQGYTPSDVSSHSLRAGGTMAMHLAGCSILAIKKMGRWKSDKSFKMYIHEQISAFSTGVSLKMSRAIPFWAMAPPPTHPPDPR